MKKEVSATTHQSSFIRPAFIGLAIGLIVICFFILGVAHPKPEWGSLWRIRPLIITPLAGALGGVAFHLLMRYQRQYKINKILAIIIAVLIFTIGLWLGVVLGLDGTLWN